MFNLPQKTLYGKPVYKKKFYENAPATKGRTLEGLFKTIAAIRWEHKIAPSTMNIAKGKNSPEIEIFTVKLNSLEPITDALRLMDKAIKNYNIVFVLLYGEKLQAWASANKTDFFCTKWLDASELQLNVIGSDTDQVYENFVRQIAGSELSYKPGETLASSVARSKVCKKLRQQIAALQKKIINEPQLNKQVELDSEMQKLQYELNIRG